MRLKVIIMIQNVRTKCMYLVKHSELGSKKLNKICAIINQKALKWSLQHVNF